MPRRWIAVVIALAAAKGIAFAQKTGEPPLLNPLKETAALLGTWDYVTANHAVSGPCPPGRAMKGQLTIAAEADRATVTMESGAVCSPASMCLFSGEFSATQIIVSNTDTVDDEGGSVTNAMFLSFRSPAEGFGRSSSRYVHPEGFECSWEHDLTLSRTPGN